jgi:hypothetical protein
MQQNHWRAAARLHPMHFEAASIRCVVVDFETLHGDERGSFDPLSVVQGAVYFLLADPGADWLACAFATSGSGRA